MCGLAGWVGVEEGKRRIALAWALGSKIDDRGGHACGFISTRADGRYLWARRSGKFEKAPVTFIKQAASGDAALLHARFATCGDANSKQHAHPFQVKREGRVVLWGAHNGVIYGAEKSAREHSRRYDVDSHELLECLADKEYDHIATLTGWGTLAWVDAASPTWVQLCPMTESAALHVVKLAQGGVVYGSTAKIVDAALKIADLTAEHSYELTAGQVYEARPDGLIMHEGRKVTLSDDWANDYAYSYYGGVGNSGRSKWYKAKYRDADEARDSWFRDRVLSDAASGVRDRGKLALPDNVYCEGCGTPCPTNCEETYSCIACGTTALTDEAYPVVEGWDSTFEEEK